MSRVQLAIETPAGRGAVGTLVLDGPDAFELFAQVFRFPSGAIPRRETFPHDRPVFGYLLISSGNDIETDAAREGTVVHCICDQRIELHVHGGDCICQTIAQTFRGLGAQIVNWNDASLYTDSVTDQVLRFLPYTLTEKTAAILLQQADGRLSRVLDRIEHKKTNGEDCTKELENLAAARRIGRHLTIPFRVLILGPVNAGKSSLINALVGFNRAVVDSTPGTTRDPVTATTAIDGWPVEFIDTAGLNATPDELEAQGIAMAMSSKNEADLILYLFDATRDDSAFDMTGQRSMESDNQEEKIVEPPSLIVLNKTDLPQSSWHSTWLNTSQADMLVSAKSGKGIDSLLHMIIEKLLPQGEEFEAIPFGMFCE
ncbi:MAG: 50S ribosome-binding GTPase [Planctomycetia bacterium]|nr:50S ribosome-binding GTPase [Planctomycetia bacterium]